MIKGVLHLIRIIDGSLCLIDVMTHWFITTVLCLSLPSISLSGTARYIVFMKPLELYAHLTNIVFRKAVFRRLQEVLATVGEAWRGVVV